MAATMQKQEPFPLDWDQWRAQWQEWIQEHASSITPSSEGFEGRNFMSDDILGTFRVKGRLVELSEVTFPNLQDRDERGRLIERTDRMVGLTFGIGVDQAGDVVRTFQELEEALGL